MNNFQFNTTTTQAQAQSQRERLLRNDNNISTNTNINSNTETNTIKQLPMIKSQLSDYSVYINLPTPIITDKKNQKEEPTNKISTSKYTTVDCIPKILVEQFSRMANIYFLIIAMLQTISEISNSDGKPVILFPLFIVVSINGIKDFYEDWKRKKSDDEENTKEAHVYNSSTGLFDNKKWEDVRLGNILKVYENEFFPADCVIINTSESNGACYIETKNIDGETNLKFKKANAKLVKAYGQEEKLKQMKGVITCQPPNEFIYEFDGVFTFDSSSSTFTSGSISALPSASPSGLPLHLNHPSSCKSLGYYSSHEFSFRPVQTEDALIEKDSFLLRGCSLRQTKYVNVFVVYVGHNTKIMKNSPTARTKLSRVEYIMNYQIIIVFLVQIMISLICSIVCMSQLSKHQDELGYLGPPPPKINNQPHHNLTFIFLILRAGTWIVLINNIVPISLVVTLEMVKYIQGMFISWDITIYDTAQRMQSKVQTSTLNEELGQVKFIFSDKTGTLTKNYMEYKAMSIGNYVYGIDKSMPNEPLMLIDLNDKYGTITNFYFQDRQFHTHLYDRSHPNYHYINLFLTCLATCHTVIVDQKKINDNEIAYQSSSPDEAAMVNCARYFDYIFAGRDINNNLLLKNTKDDNEKMFNILHTLEYTSERKRMSVIAKCPDGVIRLFIKGADSVISERVSLNKELFTVTNEHLLSFAQQGLRTLMIAYREISIEEYNIFTSEYRDAVNRLNDKEIIIGKLYDKIEANLLLLGATAIEDKLQDNVSDVLGSFIETGIKVWVLTGDKMDTAKSIAFSCNLLSHEYFIFEFPAGCSSAVIKDKLLDFSKEFYLSEGSRKKFALIVSLDELTKIFNDESLINLFYSLSIHCNSVLCCRVTPKQKAQMVSLIKDRQPNITTLAIGDGANDVNMITAANIGIGIIGVEGRQAARASDYSIAQFQFLKRLLFVHGRESYRKNSFIVCYNFYKNFLFVIPHFWFGFHSYFSGQSLYDPWVYQLFNLIFASVPIIWFGIYDKEVSYDTLMTDTRYYTQGIIGKLFHSFRFWKWIMYGILQAIFVYMYSFDANNTAINDTGYLQDLKSNGSIAYSGIVIIVNLKILFTTCTHSYVSIGLFLLSVGAYYFILYIMNLFPMFYNFNNSIMLLSSPNFYLSTLCLIMISFLIDIGTNTLLREYGWIADPLNLRPEEFEPKVELKGIEMFEISNKDKAINNTCKYIYIIVYE